MGFDLSQLLGSGGDYASLIEPVETALGGGMAIPISAPSKPKGPSSGKVGQKLEFSTSGTDPLKVHLYMFDWGDNSKPAWKKGAKQSHKYAKAGTYRIKVREKCPWNVFLSGYSKEAKVKVEAKTK